MKSIHSLAILLLLASLSFAVVKPGIDVLEESGFKPLQGKKIGLIVNPASVDSHLVPTVDILHKAKGVSLVALFGPEHGIYGDEYAGDPVPDKKDARTGLTVYSLYGKNHKPLKETMAGLDALVFDLQDIGSRSYTYLSTLRDTLQSCTAADKEFIVLDRPNPLGGNRIEGGMVEKGFESGVSHVNVPYLHGLTFGEMAQLIRDTYCPEFKKLTIIKMTGWKRDMTWQDTGLAWVPTSPHVPHVSSVAGYASTGILGELYCLSNGCGYTLPFEIVGCPWASADDLADAMNHHWVNPGRYYLTKAATRPAAVDQFQFPTSIEQDSPAPEGLYFQPTRFKPFYLTYEKTACQGVQVHIDLKKSNNLVEINYKLLQALDAPDLFAKVGKRFSMFDKVTGSSEARKILTEGRDLQPLFDQWRQSCETFRTDRKKWLLY